MMVTLQYRSRITLDAWVTGVTWATLDGGVTGSAEFSLPPDSPALDLSEDGEPLYIHDDRSAWVEVHHPHAGVWYGVTDTVTASSRGVQVTAVDPMAWTQERYCRIPRTFSSAVASTIFEAAVKDAMEGAGPVALRVGGLCMGGAPFPDDYTFSGQSLADVFNDLIDLTGMSIEIDNRRRVHLVPYAGQYREVHLSEGILDVPQREGTPGDAVSEVIGRNSLGQTRTILAPDASPWRPKQMMVQTR